VKDRREKQGLSASESARHKRQEAPVDERLLVDLVGPSQKKVWELGEKLGGIKLPSKKYAVEY